MPTSRERTGTELPELDLGGGFGIAYTSADSPASPAELATALREIIDHECAALGISGAAPVDRARSGDQRPEHLRSLRGGHGQAGRAGRRGQPALRRGGRRDERQHPDRAVRGGVLRDAGLAALVRTRRCWPGWSASTARAATSWSGTSSCPADIAPGDLVAVPASGAYSRSMASNYNHVPRPPVVAVRDGKITTLIRRETIEDLLALDLRLAGEEQ